MGRPERNTVDYFPHFISDGKKMFFIEKKYGNDGYATWFKILEKIARTENHYLNLNKEEELLFLSARCNISEIVLLNIINDLSRIGVFDKDLWESKIIWCQKFIDEIEETYKRRNNNCITLPRLCELLTGLGILKQGKCILNVDDNTQSRVEKSRVEKSRVFTPPSCEEVEQYFFENNYPKVIGKKAFKYYDVAGWKDSNGKPVKNWKQKMQSVWFKEENLIPVAPPVVSQEYIQKEIDSILPTYRKPIPINYDRDALTKGTL